MLSYNFSKRLLIILTNDLLICILTLYLSFWLRANIFPDFDRIIKPTLVAITCYCLVFTYFKVYKQFFKFISYNSILIYTKIFIIYSVLFILLLFYFQFETTPKSVALIQTPLFFLIIVFSRFIFNFIFHHKAYEFDNLIIVGTDNLAVAGYNSLVQKSKNIVFFDNNLLNINRVIDTYTIQPLSKFDNFIANNKNGKLLISSENFNSNEINSIVKKTLQYNYSISKLFMINNYLQFTPYLDHKILFDRKPRKFNKNTIYDDKTILVTGAGGSIGSELVLTLLENKVKKIIAIDFSEVNIFNLQNKITSKNNIEFILGDIKNLDLLNDIFKKNSTIDFIFHAAAYKHVPILENNITESFNNIFYATYQLAKIASKHKVKNFTLVSSDKAVRPTSIMGATKRLAEIGILSIQNISNTTIFNIVRFGNVIDSSGSVLPLFKKQIAAGGPITITHKDMVRFFMSINEAVNLIINSAVIAKKGDIFLLDMGKQLKILDLATKLIRLYGFVPVYKKKLMYNQIQIVFTGIREGEKLYEELLIDNNAINTEVDGIFLSNEFIKDTNVFIKKIITFLDNNNGNISEKFILSLLKKSNINLKSVNKK
tara:strand:+ start:2499 stop:4295 length:1797 start_codon:yes stop_codon:yes gene_type:complete